MEQLTKSKAETPSQTRAKNDASRLSMQFYAMPSASRFASTHIQNAQFIASGIEHFFGEYPVSLIVSGLIGCVFLKENIVQMNALKGLGLKPCYSDARGLAFRVAIRQSYRKHC